MSAKLKGVEVLQGQSIVIIKNVLIVIVMLMRMMQNASGDPKSFLTASYYNMKITEIKK